MANDNGLVDEFEKLENEKKEIERKEEELKKKIIELAKEKGTGVLFGNHKKCLIKEYEKIIYPDNKSELINLIKQKGLWDDLSIINYPRFQSRVSKNGIDKEILNLIKKEKAFRISLRDINDFQNLFSIGY